ncbi:hypothetical protein QR685DRAFT_522862 [Neurospora intermedia]|uniref:Uncharacterized protein n=1 Tax=Neurospora intermedia TaxID=5142 RepID=A0ABR3DCN7_NEUIN
MLFLLFMMSFFFHVCLPSFPSPLLSASLRYPSIDFLFFALFLFVLLLLSSPT